MKMDCVSILIGVVASVAFITLAYYSIYKFISLVFSNGDLVKGYYCDDGDVYE